MKVGYGISGYPGAGKSTVGKKLQVHLDGIYLETGDVVRREASEHFGCDVEELSSSELGEYSTMRRQRDGGDYVAQDIIGMLERHVTFPDKPAIITGMRDSEVPDLFEEYFDEFETVFINASKETRLSRLQNRGRQDEGEFTMYDLGRRDHREDQWGTGDIEEQATITINNNGDLGELNVILEQMFQP